jgi:signal transduction histidine kinase
MGFLVDGHTPMSDFELVLRRVAHGARLIGLGWWVSLGLFTLLGDTAENPQWVIISIGLGVAWAIGTTLVYRTDPSLTTSRLLVGGDLVLAVFAVTFGQSLAGTETNFYGGMPILAVVVAAIRGPRSAWVAAVTLAVVTGGDLTVDALASGNVVVPVSQIFVYLAGAFIATWAVGVLRRSDEQIRSATEALARSQERTQIFEHLHDSVLQTLALIQKAADRPGDVVSLARGQERELREWLYGSERGHEGGLADDVRRTATEVEERYGVPVDVIMVGDLAGGPVVEALAGAVREATVNSAKHSGAPLISVFVEVSDGRVAAFVRDRGTGFDPDLVDTDRRGISDSIRGRLQRVGGTAVLRTGEGRGTEWSLEAPT